jgi:hypothetical protein
MKTIETKRQELKNQRVKVCFMAKSHCLDIEESMHFIKVDNLVDVEVQMIWSEINLWSKKEGSLLTKERKSKLDWWV